MQPAGDVSRRHVQLFVATINPIPTITGTTNVIVGPPTTLTGAPTGGSWSSSNQGVATVNPSSGLVTPKSVGITTITYTLGGCSVSTLFTVNIYIWSWNKVGKYQEAYWDTCCHGNAPAISLNTNGSQSNPPFTFGGSTGWDVNQVFDGTSEVDTTLERYSGQASLHQIVEPDTPAAPNWDKANSITNYRAEVDLEPGWYYGDTLYAPPCEIWLSWSYYFPSKNNFMDQATQSTNGAECVWHQYMPCPAVANTPQLCLMLEAKWGNILVLQNWTKGNSVQGFGYYIPGNCNTYSTLNDCIACADTLPYGHLVAGKNQTGQNQWMDFVEHVIWDNTPKGSKGGSYQLWVTVNGVTNLWYNIQGLQTASYDSINNIYYNGTTPKFGPYYNSWEDSYPGVGNGANSIAAGTSAMEVYLGGPVKMEYNSGTNPVQASPTINGSSVPGYYIDLNGFNNLSSGGSSQNEVQDLKITKDTSNVKTPAPVTKIAPIVRIYPNPTNGTFTYPITQQIHILFWYIICLAA